MEFLSAPAFKLHFLNRGTGLILRSLLLFFIVLHSNSFAGYYNHEDRFYRTYDALLEYESTKSAVEKLWSRYSPETHIFIGIGKSPTPLIAFMKAVADEDLAKSLPLSDMGGFAPDGLDRKGAPQVYNAQLVQKLRTHLEAFLPSEAELRGKTIVLLDFAQRGLSLKNTADQIRAFLKVRSPQQTTPVIGIGIPQDQESAERLRQQGLEVLWVNDDLRTSLTLHKYKALHEYEDFDNRPASLEIPYSAPKRRTRALFLERAQNLFATRIALIGSDPDSALALKLEKRTFEKETPYIEGFNTLVEGYQAKALQDSIFRERLLNYIPWSPLLASVPYYAKPRLTKICEDLLLSIF